MALRFIVLVGSATPPGRTLGMATALADAVRAKRADVRVEVIDLADIAFECADGRPLDRYDTTIQNAVQAVADADALLVASPVYRATYTGVLKNFFDIVPIAALQNKPLGLAVLAGSQHHYLGVDAALRSLAAWYGAIALPTSVYLTGSDFDARKQLTARAHGELDGLAATAVSFAQVLGGAAFRPVPLAAQ